jgi:hypothetical protein
MRYKYSQKALLIKCDFKKIKKVVNNLFRAFFGIVLKAIYKYFFFVLLCEDLCDPRPTERRSGGLCG